MEPNARRTRSGDLGRLNTYALTRTVRAAQKKADPLCVDFPSLHSSNNSLFDLREKNGYNICENYFMLQVHCRHRTGALAATAKLFARCSNTPTLLQRWQRGRGKPLPDLSSIRGRYTQSQFQPVL
jgi:hypothetical protein